MRFTFLACYSMEFKNAVEPRKKALLQNNLNSSICEKRKKNTFDSFFFVHNRWTTGISQSLIIYSFMSFGSGKYIFKKRFYNYKIEEKQQQVFIWTSRD